MSRFAWLFRQRSAERHGLLPPGRWSFEHTPFPAQVGALFREVLDAVFPRPCPLCLEEALGDTESLCSVCLEAMETIELPYCSVCGEPLPGDREGSAMYCASCLLQAGGTHVHPLTRSACLYSGPIKEAILRVKYGGQVHLATALGHYLAQRFGAFFTPGQFTRILPVPLHPERLRTRGFNQSVLLARPLSRLLRVPLDLGSLVRPHPTPSQTGSTARQRLSNQQRAFQVRCGRFIRGQSILIVDDVYTTGSTLRAISKFLYSAGARRVTALTLARTPLVFLRSVSPDPTQAAKLQR